jgi:hypothetical protein
VTGVQTCALPAGDKQTGKIYVALDTIKSYRWSGSTFIYITSGAVDSVAGKTGVVTLVKGDVGLGNVDNTSDSIKSVASATKLQTARTIGGVSFDGTANINLPGVNTAGNQNTTGNAATATTLQTARTLTIGATGKNFNGSANLAWSLAEMGAQAALVTSTTATGITNAVTSNTNTYLNITQNGASPGSSTQITGAGSVTVASDAAGKLTITGTDTNTTYSAGTGLTLTGTVFTPTFGTTAGTVAQGNDSRIINGQTAHSWGSHVDAGYAKADGTNANGNWSNTSSGLSLNPTLIGKTLDASGQTVNLRNATYGQISGIVQDDTNSPLANQWSNRLKTLHNNSAGYFTELAQSFTGVEGVWHRRNSNGIVSSWKQLYDDSIWNNSF